MQTKNTSTDFFSARSHRFLVSLSDGALLRNVYALWRARGGRQVEKHMASCFAQAAEQNQLHTNQIGRAFRDVLIDALKLLEDDDDDSLLDMCRDAVTAHGMFDPEEFIDLQRIVGDSYLHQEPVVKNQVVEAAARLLPHTRIIGQMLEQL